MIRPNDKKEKTMVKYNPKIHNRKSIRLKGYDYSQAGLYFITICTQNRRHLFGEIKNGELKLSDAGEMAKKCWLEIPQHFPNVLLHAYITMPNHVHGILEITAGEHNTSSEKDGAQNRTKNRAKNISPPRSPSKTIGSVVRGYKIGVTKWFRTHMPNDFPIGQSAWQRNYWEHIIRNENAYRKITQYINDNPQKWVEDKLNGGAGNIVIKDNTVDKK